MSKLWIWVKTAARAAGGTSSLWLYGGLLAAGGALVGGAAWWHGSKVEAGFERGHAAATAQHLAAENRALLTQSERIATLSNDLTEALSAYSTTSNAIAAALERSRAAGQRVRSATGGDLERRLGAAECGVARTFAAGAFRTAQACRDDVAALGLGAGGLVEAAASAHYEHARADALIKFSMPRSPFTKPVEK